MSLTPEDRRVITFYSFKGGVGRTMLLANIAYRMANKHGLRVIAVDWDLEAPGLHRFFGISSETAEKNEGLLDYFVAWRKAVQEQTPEPPDVSPSIIAITDEKHAPRFGSLSLLTAGAIDESYDRRLASLDWQEFYANSAGASAVETLREQLVKQADVVLIDSRTGFTDAGGICTIQIPDGVVLVTAPNQQSLEGIDRIARAIAHAPVENRSGREKPRMWFVPSRVPLVEETYQAEQWFTANDAWFNSGKNEGLWLSEDHPQGLRSHSIPHRGRWGFDEVVLNEASKADPNDLLAVPYDRFAEALLRWLRGEPPMGLEAYRGAAALGNGLRDISALEVEVASAEQRGDIHGVAFGLFILGCALSLAGRVGEGIRKLEQARGILLSQGSWYGYASTLVMLGWSLNEVKRYEEASDVCLKALEVSRSISNPRIMASSLHRLAEAKFGMGLLDDAKRFIAESYRVLQEMDESELDSGLIVLISDSLVGFGRPEMAVEALRKTMSLAKERNEKGFEKFAIDSLVQLHDSGANLGDIAELRLRHSEVSKSPAADMPNAKKRKQKQVSSQ